MKCPKCGSRESGVLASRLTQDGFSIWRERKCKQCEHRWYTQEIEDEPMFKFSDLSRPK